MYDTPLILSLHFDGHFPGEPGLAGVYWKKGWWRLLDLIIKNRPLQTKVLATPL